MDFLCNGPIDLSYLNDSYKNELEAIFNRATKPTVAIWDIKVKRLVYSIYSKEGLQKSKILNVLIEDLDTFQKSNQYQSIIFFIKSSMKMIDMTESIINKKFCNEYHLVFVPNQLSCHMDYLVKRKLESKFQTINQFRCYGVPLENDLISLENPDFIMDMNDLTVLFDLAKTIMLIQSIYGVIPNMSGHGEKVPDFMNMLKIMNRSCPEFSLNKQSKIHQLLVFDRRVDMLTPLLCQITYEGLLDELFKFTSGFLAIPSVLLSKSGSLEHSELFQMNSSDGFYAEIRDLVINECTRKIVDFHNEVEAEREKYLKARKLEEMAEVTYNLKSFKNREKSSHFHFQMGVILNKYTKKSDYNDFMSYQNNFISQVDNDKVHPFVEEYIIKNKEIDRIIQFICIQSLCSNGLKPKVLNWYKREILRTYGLHYVAVLNRLETLGLLMVQQTSSMIPLGEKNFESLVSTLNLVPETDMQSDVSTIYAGFVPIITRLVQYHSKPGWQNISKALNLLPGQEVHMNKSLNWSTDSISSSTTGGVDYYATKTNNESEARKVVLVVYIGGVTFSEISTLRFLSRQEDSDTSYIVLTTGIINNVQYVEKLAKPYDTPKCTNPFMI